MNNYFDNIIIGGGMAGISTFYYLNKLDPMSKNLLIEKSEKIGGNIRSFNYNGKIFDYGSLELYDNYTTIDDMIKDYDVKYSLNGKLVKIVNGKNKTLNDYFNLFKVLIQNGFKSYYDIDYNVCNANSCEIINKNSYWNDYKYSYTYGSCPEMLNCIMYSMIPTKIQTSSRERMVDGSFQKLLELLVTDITKNGNKVMTNTFVTNISYINPYDKEQLKTVFTNNGEFITKNVILACPVSKLHSDILNLDKSIINDNLYTHYYTAIIKTKTDLNVDWNIYLENEPLEKKDKIITTYGRYPKIDPSLLLVFIRSDNPIRESDDNIVSFIAKNSKFGNDGTILFIDFFPESMPNMSKEILLKISENNGKNGIWFSGQYLGFPSLETAAYTGYKAALGITNSQDNTLLKILNSKENLLRIKFYYILAIIVISIIIAVIIVIIVLKYMYNRSRFYKINYL